MPVERDFVFPRWTNYIPLILLFLAIGGGLAAHVVFGVVGNPRFYEAGYEPDQPVPYSHRLHVGELGLECIYCHYNAEKSSVAGVPSTDVCMKCHDSVKTDSPKLTALRKSVENDTALEWVRVHRLPDYVHFNHKAHVQVGMDCQECHGPVETMEKVRVDSPMSMGWCLNCHRQPRGVEETISTLAINQWEDVQNTQDPMHKVMFEKNASGPRMKKRS